MQIRNNQMRVEDIEKALAFAETVGPVFIATADSEGMPHITVAGKIESCGQGCVALTEWFCPGTIANLEVNKNLSIVTWDPGSNEGYQFLGSLESIVDLAVMDGYSADIEVGPVLPQVEKRLSIRVEKVIDFTLGAHSDVEL